MIRTGAGFAAALAAGAAAVLALTAGCATTAPAADVGAGSGSGRTLEVAAAENFWGSIAAQLGGSHVVETSIIDSPAADPHDYEPTPADARAVAFARVFIQNGIGYDSAWAPKLVAANPNSGRTVLTVGDLLGLKPGDNPHQWYVKASVYKVIDAITAAYQQADPADSAYFAARRSSFELTALAPYNRLISDIRARYAGTPIGASESIAAGLAGTLGLNLITPQTFLRAVSQGNDPTAADKSLIDRQITQKAIKVYIYNSQNATPDVAAQIAQAKAAGIPVTAITETLTPAGETFQQWQVSQLEELANALARATGR
ncbi:zinc ABC transporter substrate-binding protein [Actinocrinis puniceicyclus]|uniref:Zinc ABC transporter substrate-binding protein n=1 Tax=Actinocrinis puniceicyclus TaxID=977794 RepID=A0A8J8BDJ6_9ACTN|nr:zinc ABC transporter substrate-binding protein [Actinocrinis puniceicyclus]MBS2962874.1 zinc ABC transporter substrate-binding protein [Actinocrinis puniceicyclus]